MFSEYFPPQNIPEYDCGLILCLVAISALVPVVSVVAGRNVLTFSGTLTGARACVKGWSLPNSCFRSFDFR